MSDEKPEMQSYYLNPLALRATVSVSFPAFHAASMSNMCPENASSQSGSYADSQAVNSGSSFGRSYMLNSGTSGLSLSGLFAFADMGRP